MRLMARMATECEDLESTYLITGLQKREKLRALFFTMS